MPSTDRTHSWWGATIDALWWLRPLLWAATAFALWFALVAPARADLFPFPPPGTGCPPNSSCIPGGNPGGGNPGQCTPNPNGNPGCNGAGNPVDIITGNKYQHEIDLAPLPGEHSVNFARHYNSNSTHRGLTGVGWRSTYEIVLVDLGSALQIVDADGRRLTFARHADQPSLCVSARAEDGRVIVDENPKDSLGRDAKTNTRSYRWQRPDGSEYTFNGGSGDGHPLQSIRAASGAMTTLTYLGGALDSVRDPQGRTLRFIYARPLAAGSTRHRMLALSAIETPVGRISYKLDDNGRLQTVTQPNGLVHRYHYEAERQGTAANIWALTGISVEWPQDGQAITQRLATYTYDAQGRAVRTQHVGGDDVSLSYGPRAQTVISLNKGANPGARTVYRHALVAGQWKTVEAIGPGCATCPPSNMRYRYRIDGSMAGALEATLRLDDQGKPLQQERVQSDASGRPIRVEQIGYVAGKAQPAKVVLRAEYTAMPPDALTSQMSGPQFAALWRPKLVARPSVVAGLEHAIAITYNAHLQPVTMTEAGASPIGADGNFKPTALVRTTSYSYSQIAGANRLIGVDGPLPGRADTIKYHYDDQGRLRLVQHPVADLQERFAYDDAGRVVWHTPSDAVETRTTFPAPADTLANNPGLPASISRAGRTASYRYNMRGWLARWDSGPQRSVILSYNSEGRVVEARDAQGNRVTWNRDEAKQLETRFWFDSSQATAATPSPQRAYYRWFDQADRTVKTLAADGRSDEYLYDLQGRLTQHLDGDGIAHLYRERTDNRSGDTQARIDMAPDGEVRLFMSRQMSRDGGDDPIASSTPNADSSHRRLRDDFGRIVRVDLPAHGARVTQYDEANRIKRIVFADGAKVEFEHDAASRTIVKAVTGINGERESITTLRYHGAYLIEVVDPAQATGYRYDSAGRRVETRITLTSLAGPLSAQVYTIGTVFDAQGDPIEHRLADGRTMTVERDAATQLPTALVLRARGLHPAQPILSSINAHPFDGITGFTNGNGLTTTRGYDNVGRLTALTTGSVLDLRYEHKAGPRIRSIRNDGRAKNTQAVVDTLSYDGFGALLLKTAADENQRTAPPRPAFVRANFGDTAVADNSVARDVRGRLVADDQHLYRYDALGRLVAVRERAQGKLIASYTYNAFGERVSKTTTDPQGRPITRQFLYQHSKLVAEIVVGDSGTASIERQYIYLNEAPVAALEADRVLAIHTDHRGTPLAMTDAQQRVVWRATYRDAWGEAQAIDTSGFDVPAWKVLLHRASAGRLGEADHGAAKLNLRLPGQYADEETGLHYNLHRYYDPRADAAAESVVQRVSFNGRGVHSQGRYLTPDPLGYPDGPDPYLYANGDPINKIDPLGLYNADVHYFMTFFLAIAAGMRAEDARMMALATQFIDDNDATQPLNLTGGHQNRLLRYHFVLTDPGTGQLYPGVNDAGLTTHLAGNPQLRALYSYAAPTPPPGSCNFPNNRSLQFMGEYLHAFEDTFSHRDRYNRPFDINNGGGHGHEFHDPDYTFNHRDNLYRAWSVNENRTFVMEEQVYSQITRYMTEMNFFVSGRHSGRVVGFDQLRTVLSQFNANRMTDSSGPAFNAKIAILNSALARMGFAGIDMAPSGPYGYDRAMAEANRRRNFAGLDPGEFPNAILDTR